MTEVITMAHGSGCSMTRDLIGNLFAAKFGMTGPLTDSAILDADGCILAFTTDSYVVDPIFFPGGDIGKLAVCGTVNDLAVSGAYPQFLAASFIIEEGFPVKDLETIVSSMAGEAALAGVRIVTGDTKVVEKGKCDKIFITTSGTGILQAGLGYISTGERVRNGDKLIINGPLGNHAVAILGARNNLRFRSEVVSDCRSLNHVIRKVMDRCNSIRFMRDLTRGGLAVVLNELAGMIGKRVIINESAVPVDAPVKGLCEILGFDPLYLANEGKFLIVAGEEDQEKVLEIMRNDPAGESSMVIGEISAEPGTKVILNTIIGGKRILDMPSGLQLPRIC